VSARRRSGARDRVFLLYAVSWVAALLAVRDPDGRAAGLVNLAYFGAGAVTIVTLRRAARGAADRAEARGWSLLAVSHALLWLNGLVWTYWQPLTGAALGVVANRVWENAYVPFGIAGFLAFPSHRDFRWRDARALVDVALLGVGLSALWWHFALVPYADARMYWDVAGAVGNYAMALAGGITVVRGAGRELRLSVGLVLAAHLAYVLTEYFWLQTADTYQAGHLIDAFWFGCWMLRWLGARVAVEPRRTPGMPGARPIGGYRGTITPALFVAGAYGLLLIALALDRSRNPLDVGIAVIVMTALLLTRQHLTFRDNAGIAEQAARQAAVFRSLVASAADLVLLVDPAMRIAYASPSVARLAGEVEGTPLLDLLHPDDRAGAQEWLVERSSSFGLRAYRCRVRTADGGWRDLELRSQDRTGDAAVEGYVLNGRDVTQELALERRLGHARKLAMLSEMAGRIAHAFNNALAAVQARAEVLARDLPAGSAAQEDARAIGAAAERGAGITRQLLGFSGRHVIQPEALRPLQVVEALRPTLTRVLGPARTLAVAAADAEATCLVDRAQFEQVLVNLVTNARDAMPEGGILTVHVSREPAPEGGPPMVRVAVRDTGVGMPEEVRARVFEPFFTTKAPGSGTGLGLAMVASIIRRAGGDVSVESAPGAGTTVALRLPAVERRVTPPPMRAYDQPEPAPGTRRRILLVDDDEMVRRASARMLARAGYAVLEAEDGAQALTLAGNAGEPVDLLLTDLMMPGLSGRDVIARFRVLRPGVPVVCVTGYASQREEEASIDLHVNAIVGKPFTAQTLLRAIESAFTPEAGDRAG